MKYLPKLLLLPGLALASLAAPAQFVATMEVKEPIPGICDEKAVYAIFPGMADQEKALCPVTEAQIAERINAESAFLKENPKYKDKGMMGVVVNCKGEAVRVQMDNTTKSPELDKQIEAVFSALGAWKPAKLNGKEVDSSELFRFTIKGGKLTFE